MQTFRELRLNKVLFSHFALLIAVLKREWFGNPCGGRGVSPHLNASSQHLCLSLLQVVSVFRFHTYDLDVVSSFRMLSPLSGIPSKQLKPRKIGAAVRRNLNLSSVQLSHFNSASRLPSSKAKFLKFHDTNFAQYDWDTKGLLNVGIVSVWKSVSERADCN